MNNLTSKEFGRHYIEVIWNQADLGRLQEFTVPDIGRHDPTGGDDGFAHSPLSISTTGTTRFMRCR